MCHTDSLDVCKYWKNLWRSSPRNKRRMGGWNFMWLIYVVVLQSKLMDEHFFVGHFFIRILKSAISSVWVLMNSVALLLPILSLFRKQSRLVPHSIYIVRLVYVNTIFQQTGLDWSQEVCVCVWCSVCASSQSLMSGNYVQRSVWRCWSNNNTHPTLFIQIYFRNCDRDHYYYY